MEQNNNLPQSELEQLRSRINDKAANAHKHDLAYGGWIVLALFAIFESLNLYFDWFPHHLSIGVTFVASALLIAVSHAVGGVLLRKMRRAGSAAEHYKAAMNFVRCRQLFHSVSFGMAFLFADSIYGGWGGPSSFIVPLVIVGLYLLICCLKRDMFIDSDFYEDIMELEQEK